MKLPTEPGRLVLPLRAFLGVTFSYAGLQKLANPDYLDPSSPTSVAHQMALLRHTSPIGPLLTLSTHAPTLVGLLIAFGELAVGIGTLLGFLSRIAALGGAVLALTFFLTVSWTTTPYYYGADIVFVFAWLVLVAFGDGGVLSVEAWLRNRARRDVGLGPAPATVTIAAPRLRSLCGRGVKCGLGSDGECSRRAGCPVFPLDEHLPVRDEAKLARRTVVVGGAATAVVGALTVALAGVTAAIGRAVGGTPKRSAAAFGPDTTSASASSPGSSSASASSPPTASSSSSSATATGMAVATAASIQVGHAKSFTNPADGNPAWVVHTSGTTFVAFSAVCTHAGCPVQFDSSTVEFVCPCHGGSYDARTGKVLGGPPPSPLPAIAVHVVNGQVRVG